MTNTGNKLIDTSVLVAFFNKDDDFHKDAIDVIKNLTSSVILLETVLNETLALLRKRISKEVATKAAKEFSRSTLFEMFISSDIVIKRSLNLFIDNKAKYSFTDCVVVTEAKERKATVLGFDKHFREFAL